MQADMSWSQIPRVDGARQAAILATLLYNGEILFWSLAAPFTGRCSQSSHFEKEFQCLALLLVYC